MWLSSSYSIRCLTYTATTEIYTLSLHDALPIWPIVNMMKMTGSMYQWPRSQVESTREPTVPIFLRAYQVTMTSRPITNQKRDRKSTRLNSSHLGISYAVFCLKKKKKKIITKTQH